MKSNQYNIISYVDISTDEDYPKNLNKIIEEWKLGKVNNLKIGDKVRLKYLMNTDGKYDPLRFENQIGNVKDIKSIKYQDNNGKWIVIDWDKQELKDKNSCEYLWNPYSFIKIK